MNTFKITIRPKLEESWPVVGEYTRSDNLTREHRGELKLSEPDFTRLISLQIQHREYGTFLGRALFRGDIETAYREAFVSSEAGLRVLLVVEDPELRKLYWHWLCTPPNWDFIALAQRCPFSVYIPSRSDRIFQPATREELKALILVASPEDSEQWGLAKFDVEETVARLKTALGDIPTDVLAFAEGSVGEPTLPRLLNQLTQKSYTLLHVVCHGKVVKNGETVLYWATEENRVRPIPSSNLLTQLNRQGVTGLPRLVFLSACESATPEAETALGGLAQRMGRELGIPAVLAMTQRVAIETAGLLSAAFYPRLREHGEVDRALVEATSILDRHDILVPALFSRLGTQSLFVVESESTPDPSNQIIYNYNYYYREEATATATDGTEEVDDLPCPYRGLFSFEPEDAEYFFGRDIFIEELYRATQNRNFIPILGASGSGKSSVILAGLVPKLLKEGHWKFTHFRPGKEPFHALAQALVPLYAKDLDETDRIAQSRKLAEYFLEGTVPLSDVFKTIQNNHPQDRILLIADQFEELYTLCENVKTRRQFLNLLLHTFRSLAEASSLSIVLVAAMRADFLGNVLSYPPLADVLRDVDIKIRSMNGEELWEVIEKPAEKLGVSFEHGLVERILKDIDKEPGNLPLLEFALTELWKRRKGKQLTHEAYQEIGEVSGALTGYADEEFNRLKPEDKERVRQIFVQLVQPGAGTEDTRRVATKAELSESNWGLVKQLADARLVVTSRRTIISSEVSDLSTHKSENREQETVEVIHEALIRNWGQLKGWMQTDREFRAWQERLRDAMHQWEEMKKDEGLLLRGAALFQAQEKLQERQEELSEGERLFIQLSQELQDQERYQKQRQRRQIIVGLVASFVTVSMVAGIAVLQWWKTYIAEKNAEMRANINNLNYRFSATQDFDALVEGIKLAKELQETRQRWVEINTKIQVIDTIRKIVYHRGFNEFNTLERHTKEVNDVALNHDGRFIASASTDTTATVWRADGTVKAILAGHRKPIYRVAFGYHLYYSQKEELIITASADKTAIIWNLNGEKVAILKHNSPVYRVAFSPQKDMIVTATDNGTISFWRFENQSFKLFKRYPSDGAAIRGLSFSQEGDLIAAGSANGTIKLWNRDGNFLKTLEGHSDKVYSVAFSPKGDLIASASFDHTVKLWSGDGKFLKTLEGHSDKVYSVAFSPEGELIATASHDNTVRIWSREGTLVDTLQGHGNIVYNAVFGPTGNWVASASVDSKVKLWKYNPLQDTYKDYHCRRIAFSADGQLIALVCYDKRFYILNAEDIANPIFKSEKRNSYFLSVAFSPKAELIATGNQEGTIELWNFEGGLVRSWQGHDQQIYDIDFSYDGNIIATTSNDKTIKFWDVNGNLLKDRSLENIPKPQSIDFSPIEDAIAIGSAHDIIKKSRHNNTYFTEKFVVGHEGQILNVRFSPDGAFIVSTGWDQILKIWTNDGRLIKSIEEHSGPVTDVAFESDGSLLASTSHDTTVKLWTLDGKLIHTLLGHDHIVESLAFRPDGTMIATISDDKTLKVWNLDLDDLLKKGCDWVIDYLKNNPHIQESKRRICNVEASSTALLLQGEKMAIDGKIEAASVLFKRALKEDEGLGRIAAQILVASGIKFSINNSNSEAKIYFDEALKFDPSLTLTPKIDTQKFSERNPF